MSNTTAAPKPTPNDILRLFLENDQEGTEELTHVESSEWEQDYKYQLRQTVVHHVASDTFWEFHESRTGSYHTDWYTNELEEPRQVVQKEVTKTIWVAAPQGSTRCAHLRERGVAAVKALVYAVRFASGTYYGCPPHLSAGVPQGAARFFAKSAPAKTIANKKWNKDQGAEVVSFELTEVPA